MNYLLIGQEEYLKDQFLDKLKKSILKEDAKGNLDYDVFVAGDFDTESLLNSANTLPFFSKRKITVIKNILKLRTCEKEAILKILKSPPRLTTLVLENGATKINQFLKEVSKLAKIVKCERLGEGELTAWIKREFAMHKKKISFSAINLIKELSGHDLYLLKNEIVKIVSFIKDKEEVTGYHIELVLGRSATKNAFELVDLVLENNLDRAFSFIGKLITKEKPHQILNIIAWQLRNFIRIKSLPKNHSLDDVASTLGINWHLAKKAASQSQRFSQSDLKRNLDIILEADLSIKRSKISPQYALERALVEMSR